MRRQTPSSRKWPFGKSPAHGLNRALPGPFTFSKPMSHHDPTNLPVGVSNCPPWPLLCGPATVAWLCGLTTSSRENEKTYQQGGSSDDTDFCARAWTSHCGKHVPRSRSAAAPVFEADAKCLHDRQPIVARMPQRAAVLQRCLRGQGAQRKLGNCRMHDRLLQSL